VACGAALSKRMNGDPNLVFSLHGDGELQEGQIWEAALFAHHHRLDHLISCVDWNGQQIDGPTEKVMSLGNLKEKFEAFGWITIPLEQGNQMSEVVKALEAARAATGQGKPIMILMKTAMGAGVDFMMNDHRWHGVAPNDEQLARALNQLPETLGDF